MMQLHRLTGPASSAACLREQCPANAANVVGGPISARRPADLDRDQPTSPTPAAPGARQGLARERQAQRGQKSAVGGYTQVDQPAPGATEPGS